VVRERPYTSPRPYVGPVCLPILVRGDAGLGVWAVEPDGGEGHQDRHLHIVVTQGLAGEAYLPQEIPAI
jgi:hypothetical protein